MENGKKKKSPMDGRARISSGVVLLLAFESFEFISIASHQ
jgi:hypothetical protein